MFSNLILIIVNKIVKWLSKKQSEVGRIILLNFEKYYV